jgi:hypothetical protein
VLLQTVAYHPGARPPTGAPSLWAGRLHRKPTVGKGGFSTSPSPLFTLSKTRTLCAEAAATVIRIFSQAVQAGHCEASHPSGLVRTSGETGRLRET